MEVEAMVRPVVEAAGLELVEASLLRERGQRILRVTVDREGGVDLDTLGTVSERVSRRLDLEGFDPGPYHLEMSSPGVERLLREPRDFARRVGEKVRVRTSRPIDGSRTLRGTIVAADDRMVAISTEIGEQIVAYDDIAAARTMFEWGPSKAKAKGGGR
jgi:ribosome maturation factor RimP